MPKYLHEFVMNGSGDYVNETAGEALGKHKLVYRGVDGYWYLADADAATTMPVLGITMSEIAATRKGEILLEGYIGDTSWTWTGGGEVYASTTAGELTQTMPTGAGDVIQVVAIAVEATIIQFTGKAGNALYASNTLEGETAFVGFDASKSHYVNYFLCDGVADDVQINVATAYTLSLGGGSVMLERGAFNTVSTSSVGTAVELIGNGNDTVINFNAAGNAVTLAGDNASLKNLKIVITPGAGGAGTRPNGIYSQGRSNLLVEDIWVYGDETVIDDGSYTRQNGVYFVGVTDSKIIKCRLEHCMRSGLVLAQSSVGNFVDDNLISDNTGINVYIYNTSNDNNIKNNEINGSDSYGIHVSGSHRNIVEANKTNSNASSGILVSSSGNDNVVSLNISRLNTINGIYINSDNNVINSNICSRNTQNGIYLDADDNTVTGNTCNENTRNGMYVNNATNNNITANTCNENDYGNTNTYHGILLGGQENTVEANVCDANDAYGIYVTGSDNTVKHNTLTNNTDGAIIDEPRNTKLSSVSYQFIKELNGTYLTASPTGVEIDANTEAAILQGHIPKETQQIIRIRVYAVALAGPIGQGGQMHAEFTFNAGSPGGAYNAAGKSWTLANHDSEESDYINGYVVTWVIEDSDVGNELSALTANDKFELIVTHEAGADPDGETDAVFGSLEVEYV